jgi:hypothetical protein
MGADGEQPWASFCSLPFCLSVTFICRSIPCRSEWRTNRRSCLLALFTHNHLFWVIALLLALVDLPGFSTPLRSIAGSVQKMAGIPPDPDPSEPPAEMAAHTTSADVSGKTKDPVGKREVQGHA